MHSHAESAKEAAATTLARPQEAPRIASVAPNDARLRVEQLKLSTEADMNIANPSLRWPGVPKSQLP